MCPIHLGVDPNKIDPRTGHPRQYFTETFASDSGSGAVKGHDGWLGIGFAAAAGNFLRPNIEQFEQQCPYVVNEVKVLEDWEGAGEFRGAPGTLLDFTAYTVAGAPAMLQTGNSDGARFSPPGVVEGGTAPLSQITVYGADGSKRPLRTIDIQPVSPGDRCVTKCAGGGGWGNPLDRAVAKVQDDVVDGYVSVERAKNVYGVVLNPETLEVQVEATQRVRAELRAKPA
jgi:N-methylhydantoinase B